MELRKNRVWISNFFDSTPKVLQFFLCILLGLVFSRFFAVISPLFVLAAIGGILFLFVSLLMPEIGILMIVIIVSSVIFEKALPLIPLPFGSFHVTDVLLLSLLVIIPFKLFTNRNFKVSRTNLDKPLLLFYFAAIVSVYLAITYYNLNFNIVIRQFRFITYYLIYFVITNLTKEKKQIILIIKGLFTIATMVAIVMILQGIVGEHVKLMPGRVERPVTLEQVYEVTRILPPGQTMIYIMFITGICTVVLMKKPILKSKVFYIDFILGMGILLTFQRGYWIAIIFSLSIFFVLISKRNKMRIIALCIIVFMLIGTLSLAFSSTGGRPKEYLFSIFDRFASLLSGEKMFYSSTLDWRKIENEFALRQIAKHPLFGIGLANNYRPTIIGMNEDPDWNASSYIHNGYLWILVKMGLIGFFPFIWFFIRFLVRGF